jgi:hypothetical protein
VNQRLEMDGRELILKELFCKENVLQHVMHDQTYGVSTIQKILASGCVSQEERIRYADRVRAMIATTPGLDDHPVAYKRLLDELSSIPLSLNMSKSYNPADDIVSPLAPAAGFFPSSPSYKDSPPRSNSDEHAMFNYQQEVVPGLPTPNQSPFHKSFSPSSKRMSPSKHAFAGSHLDTGAPIKHQPVPTLGFAPELNRPNRKN